MTRSECTCRGYDPADPAMHGNTSQGCPIHDPLEQATACDSCAELFPLGDLIDTSDPHGPRVICDDCWSTETLANEPTHMRGSE